MAQVFDSSGHQKFYLRLVVAIKAVNERNIIKSLNWNMANLTIQLCSMITCTVYMLKYITYKFQLSVSQSLFAILNDTILQVLDR